MRVAFVTTNYPPRTPGGAGVSSQLIVESLRDLGVEVDVFALVGERKDLVAKKTKEYHLPSADQYPGPEFVGENISAFAYLPSLNEYDLLHVYNVRQLPACIIRSDIPVVATFNNHMWVCIDPIEHLRDGIPKCDISQNYHYAGTRGFSGLKRVGRVMLDTLGKQLTTRADAITVQTRGMKTVLSKCGYNPKKIYVVPNILDAKFDIKPKNENRVMFAGRLIESKGPRTLVQAFGSLPQSLKEQWELKIYGTGPLKKEVLDMIVDLEIPNAELRYCEYSDLPEEYAAAGIFVHPSQYTEPFSRSWLEAMASGTPIICSRNPSSETAISDIAELFDPFDSIELSKKIEELMNDIDRRGSMAKLSKDASSRYKKHHVSKKYQELYIQLQ